MKHVTKAVGLLACLLVLCSGCGKQEETLNINETVPIETTASTETTEEETMTEETTVADTTAAETTAIPDTTETMTTTLTTETETVAENHNDQSDNDNNIDNGSVQQTPNQKDEPITTVPSPTKPSGDVIGDEVTFAYNGQALRVGDNASDFVNAVPENSKESSQSCYGNGEDINYYYDNFTIFVWNDNGSYTTIGIDITGPDVTTQLGIGIGSSADDVVAAYGSEYAVEGSDYVYTYDDCSLRFTIADGKVNYISYNKDME